MFFFCAPRCCFGVYCLRSSPPPPQPFPNSDGPCLYFVSVTFLQGKPFRRLESAWKNTQKAPSLFASCKGQPISFLNYFVSLWVPQNITKLHRRDSTNCKLVKYSQPKKYAFYRRGESYELWLLTKLMVLKLFWWPCRETSFIFQEKPQYSTQLATAHAWPGKFTHWLPSNSSTVHTGQIQKH